MSYTDGPSLETFLATGVGAWPLRETCTPEEATLKTAIHAAIGRRVTAILDANGVQTGWNTLTPAPVEVPDGTPPLERWDAEFEMNVDIMFE